MKALIGSALLLMMLASGAVSEADTISAGTLIAGRVQQELSTKTARDGDPFTIRTGEGATIYGHLSDVVSWNASRKAHITLNLDRIRFPDGSTEPIRAKLVSVEKRETSADVVIPRYAPVRMQLTDILVAR